MLSCCRSRFNSISSEALSRGAFAELAWFRPTSIDHFFTQLWKDISEDGGPLLALAIANEVASTRSARDDVLNGRGDASVYVLAIGSIWDSVLK